MKFSSRILAALVVASSAPAAFGQSRLQIIHSSDNESSFQDPNTLEEKVINYSALVNGLQQLASNEGIPSLHLTAGDHTIPGPFYLASSEVEQYGQNGLADIAIYNAFPNAANGIGNHEFDGGIDDFAHMVSAANYPFIAVNLDFTNVELMEGTPALTIGPDAGPCADVLGQVVKSCHVPAGDLTVGLIGRAPADFFNVVAADAVPGLDFVGGRDEGDQPIESAVPMVLEQVDLLTAAGASIIVLLDHAQDFTGDPLSAEALRGVDIIVAAGSSGFLAGEENGPFNFLREGEMGDANYPLVRTDSEGKTVLVVNSDQLYAYVGNLIVDFDENGDVVGYDMERSGPIATTQDAIDLLATELGVDTLEPIPEVREVLDLLQATPSITSSFEVIGSTEFELNGERVFVRGRETNLGRLAADSSLWEGNRYAAANSLPAIDVALKNGGGIRDTIVGPNVIRLTIEAALAFDNKLAIVELTGGQLLATMENSVSRVPAADGRFPQIAGMMMEYITTVDGVQGAATLDTPTRVKSLVITRADGSTDVLVEDFAAVGDLSRTFVMATNSFLTGGGDDYASLAAGTTLGETELGEQDILEDYIVTELGGSVDIMDPPPMPRIVADPMDTDAPVPAPSDAPVVAPTAAPVDVPSDAPVPAPTEDESAAIRIISSLWALFAFLFVL